MIFIVFFIWFNMPRFYMGNSDLCKFSSTRVIFNDLLEQFFLLGTQEWSSIAQGDQLNHMMKFSSWAGLDHELKSHEAHFTLSCFDNEIVGAF